MQARKNVFSLIGNILLAVSAVDGRVGFSLIMNIMLLAVTTIGDEEAEAQVKVDHGMTRAMAKKQARALPRALAM